MKPIAIISVVAVAAVAASWLIAADAPTAGKPAGQSAVQPAAQTAAPAAQPTSESLLTKVCYIIGMDIGRKFAADGIDPDMKAFNEGIRAGLKGMEPRYTQEDAVKCMTEFEQYVMAERAKRDQQLIAVNREKGKAYCQAHAKGAGVTVLPSGLQYKVLTAGTGAKPTADDQVTVHYRGTLIDGTEFDSSHKRGMPATFPVKGVIAGWTEALQLMSEGATWQLVIPADLAYGDVRKGPVIAPGSTLVFEVQLIKVASAAPAGE